LFRPCCYEIQLQNFLDVERTTFSAFAKILDPLKKIGMTTLTTSRVMSSIPYIHA
jgi:hypothetical protein